MTALPRRPAAVALILAAALSGCAQLSPDFGHQEEAKEQVSRVDKHSSFPALRRVHFEQANLIELIDPSGQAKVAFEKAWSDGTNRDSPAAFGVKYDLVLSWFRATEAMTPEEKRIHRDGVQDKLLAISTSRCNVFKTYLRRQQSDVNFGLGVATTAAGVLGAVLPGVNASRNLSGVAGFLSGAQAEFNSSYYSNMAAQVIIQGIELRQARQRKELLEARQGKPVAEYSMEAALNDAIVIDGTCSTVTGLMEAADSIKEVSSPGLPTAANVMLAVRAMNEIAQADKVSELMESGKLQQLLKQASPAVSPLSVVNVGKPPTPAATVQQAMVDASKARARINADRAAVAVALQQKFLTSQQKLDTPARAEAALGAGLASAFDRRVETATTHITKQLDPCLAALGQSATALGAANAATQLEPKDDATRIAATASLAQAVGNAQASAERVNVLVRAARQTAELVAQAWQAEFMTPKLTQKQLDDTPVPSLPNSPSGLCPPTN